MPRTEAEIVQELLGILQHYAPTSHEQQVCSELVWDMQSHHASMDTQIGTLAGAIHDGLHYGNWPWDVVRRSAPDGFAPGAPGHLN